MTSLYMTGNYRSNNDSLERVNTCIHRSNGMEYIEHVFFFFFLQYISNNYFSEWHFVFSSLKKGDTILNGSRKVYAIQLLLNRLNFIQWGVILHKYQFYCTDIWLHQKNSDILFKANIWGYLNSNCKSYTCQTTVTILEIIHYS